MADDTTESRKGKKDEGDRERSQIAPRATDSDFTLWIETLFWAEPEPQHFPERIDVCIASGPRLERLGRPLKTRDFVAAKSNKPARPQLVSFANEILHFIRRDADVRRKGEIVYSINAWHFQLNDYPYERYTIRITPRGDYTDTADGAEDERSSMNEQFGVQILTHHEKMFALYGGAVEGLLDRLDRVQERDGQEIKNLRTENSELRGQLERALNAQAERDARRQMDELKIRAADRGLDLAFSVVPVLVNKLAGTNALQIPESNEAAILKPYFKPKAAGGILSQEQSEAVFGKFKSEPPFDVIKDGVLTFPQGKLLYDISERALPIDEIDKLLPGGALEVTPEQLNRLMTSCGLQLEQLAPIKMLLDSRLERQKQNGK